MFLSNCLPFYFVHNRGRIKILRFIFYLDSASGTRREMFLILVHYHCYQNGDEKHRLSASVTGKKQMCSRVFVCIL